MLEWSVRSLRAVEAVEAIVVALPAQTVASRPRDHTYIAVAGGATRSHSVRAALDAAPAGDPVIVHDAARPLATPELFASALAELGQSGADAVVAATQVPDTIKEVGEDGVTVARTLPRTRLWAVQTPQVFRREVLARTLSEASDALLAVATDDSWLIERAGGVVRVLAADPANIKITSPTDLRVAELLLSERRS